MQSLAKEPLALCLKCSSLGDGLSGESLPGVMRRQKSREEGEVDFLLAVWQHHQEV